MSPGLSVAHYRISSKLGEGGMGEVWRATDTKLGRDVAIKVLPELFASDPDRMARFIREAQVLASLNHPNIAAIYGVEERALVMELAEGPTLAERIAQGALPVDEAIAIAQQIAEGLEYAHERGIVHRDLKPANIKITIEGRVKLLDFGLAKAMSPELAAGSPVSSPTLTMRATMAGVILGTAAYMSPEQARGHAIDKRSDIWSFGVVLYEMLTGRRLFDAPTISDSLAAVLRSDPDWSALPAAVPPNIRAMLRRCLERDPKRRLHDIADARLELEQPVVEPSQPGAAPAAARPSRLPWVAAAVMAIAAVVVSTVHFREKPPAAPIVRFTVPPPEKGHFNAWIALSPDGRYLGFTGAGPDGIGRIWVRSLDSLELRALPGTDGVITFFWSPDSRYIAFHSGGKLKKVDIFGGPAQTLCEGVAVLLGGSWNPDGTLLFGSNNGPIMRVSSAGGVSTPVTKLDPTRDENNHTDPIFLPDGRHFLYVRRSSHPENAGVYAGSLDAKPEQQSLKRIQATDFSAGYAPAHGQSPGRLLFLREDNLMAQAFDERHLEVTGEPVPVAEQVGTSITRAFFSVSPAGLLAHRGGGGEYTQFSWFDREGHLLGRAGVPGSYDDLALSADGHIAYSPRVGTTRQIWVMDPTRSVNSRLTFLAEGGRSPAWSADGQYLAFASVRGISLYIKNANNGGPAQPVLADGGPKFVNDWSRDGRYVIYTDVGKSMDVMALPNPLGGGDRKPFAVVNSGFNETQGQLSPDSRWIAYASDEAGRYDIFVRPFPPGDGREGKWLVSSAGGLQPRWRSDGKELYYLELDQRLMAVDVQTGAAFQSLTPHSLFATPTITGASNVLMRYDVSRDGKKFLMVDVANNEGSAPVTVVLNWEAGLKK